MITNSFDNKTKPIVTLKALYGEQKHLIDKCLIIFSIKIYNFILKKFNTKLIGQIKACNGNTDIYSFSYENTDTAFYLSPLGSTLAAQCCAECNWIVGATKFIMFGSAGSLDFNKTKGKFVIPIEAYRDEGMSYHYAIANDYIKIKNFNKVKLIFENLNLPYIVGRVWTTDAFLMETIGLTNKRKEEGCIAVEMELAGVQAVCDFYGFELYNFLVTGDVLKPSKYKVGSLSDANHNIDKLYYALEIAKRI